VYSTSLGFGLVYFLFFIFKFSFFIFKSSFIDSIGFILNLLYLYSTIIQLLINIFLIFPHICLWIQVIFFGSWIRIVLTRGFEYLPLLEGFFRVRQR